MTTINLKDFYYWYTQDQFIEVSDEVAEVFVADARHEMAYQRRLSRHKAQYSLDCDDGIEYSACLHEPTPQELLERMELFIRLWNALNSLPESQGRRIDAHIISSTLPRTSSLSWPLITSSFSCTIFSDMVCCLLSDGVSRLRSTRDLQAMSLFVFAKLILPYQNCPH